MYKILGVYVFSVTSLPVANLLTADNNEPRKPPTISYMWTLGHMLKKTPDTLTMTSTYRHIISQTDFTTGLTRLDQQCNRTRTKTVDKNGKRKSSRFAFLKISASAHCTHLQSRSIQPAAQALQKSAILPTLKRQHQRS